MTDPAIERAQLARTVVGVFGTVGLYTAFPARESVSDLALGRIGEVVVAAALMALTGPVVLAVFIVAARPPLRRRYLHRLSGPLKSFAAIVVPLPVLILVTSEFGPGSGYSGLTRVVTDVLAVGTVLYATVFLAFASVLCVRHAFRAADVHDVLPPLVSPVLYWLMAAVKLADGVPLAAPDVVLVLLLLSPPVSVTLLSWWSLRRLRIHHRLTVRGALGRGPSG